MFEIDINIILCKILREVWWNYLCKNMCFFRSFTNRLQKLLISWLLWDTALYI